MTPPRPRHATIIPTTAIINPRTKLKFVRRFLRSMSKMSKTRPSSSSSSSNIRVKKRSERLKMAAYWCMARAVGSKRAWSRAILMKLSRARQHHYQHFSMKRRMRGKSTRSSTCRLLLGKIKKKKKKNRNCSSSYDEDEDDEDGLMMKRQTEKLREVVPGGKLMDICSLLEETAHFVSCLAAQVHVMQTIAHHCS